MKSIFRGGIPFIIMQSIALLLYYQGQYKDAKSTFFSGLVAFIVAAPTINATNPLKEYGFCINI